jgi:hypothetical protein
MSTNETIYDYSDALFTIAPGQAAGVVVVDGKKDSFYDGLTGPADGYLQIKSYAFNDNGIPSGDWDLSAKVWTAWDDQWLYLYEEVMDDTISGGASVAYNNDCIEIKIDPQPTDSVNNSVWDTRYTALSKGDPGVMSSDSLNNVPIGQKQWARTKIPGGYALELAVKWVAITSGSEIVTPAVGNVFGMAIFNHDNDKGTRQASVQWAAVLLDAAWNTPKYLGTVKFLANHKLQFIAKNHMTGVTNKVPYDGTPFYMRIDAKKDPFYHSLSAPDNGYLQIRSYAWNDNGKPSNDADLSAKVWAAWDDQWLYLYEEVKDNVLSGNAVDVWNNDCVELKIDPQPTDSVTNSNWDTRLTALDMGSPGVVTSDNLNSVPAGQKQWTRTQITGGYALELAVKWAAIKSGSETISAAVGNVFGLAINQNDNDGSGRDATIQWAAVLLNEAWETPKYLGTVKFLNGHQLQFIPRNNMTGRYNPIPYDGSNYTRTGIKDAGIVPSSFSLGQNYPNPFNPSTAISISVSKPSKIRLEIFDLLGRRIRVLLNETLSPGTHEVRWDGLDESGKSVGSGIYICKVSDGSQSLSKKMLKVQ